MRAIAASSSGGMTLAKSLTAPSSGGGACRTCADATDPIATISAHASSAPARKAPCSAPCRPAIDIVGQRFHGREIGGEEPRGVTAGERRLQAREHAGERALVFGPEM